MRKLGLLATGLLSKRRGIPRVEQCVDKLQLQGICACTTLATAGLCAYKVYSMLVKVVCGHAVYVISPVFSMTLQNTLHSIEELTGVLPEPLIRIQVEQRSQCPPHSKCCLVVQSSSGNAAKMSILCTILCSLQIWYCTDVMHNSMKLRTHWA